MRVKLKRIEKGFKQFELAKIVGISSTYLRQIESGQANPTKDIMEKIASALDTPAGVLFFEEDREVI